MSTMFNGSALSTSNYNSILDGWSKLNVQPSLYFGGAGLVYSPNGLAGHDTLSNINGWIFTGDAFISTNTIYQNASFTFTVNATNYNSGDYTLSSIDLSPSSSVETYDGNAPKKIVYSNLIFTSSGTNKLVNVSNNVDINTNYSLTVQSYPCFKEGSRILTDKGYKPIQDLRKGDLVKTILHNFKPIDMIGKRDIVHIASEERIKDQLYKCSETEYPKIFEPLIITGCHSILVDEFTGNDQRDKVIEVLGDTYVTDNKYRLPACVDERAHIYEIPGNYTIYHFALENDDYYMNYGIFANGLLVESCSKRYLKELSNMTLIE